jgi:hypothetical protein
MVKRGYSKPPPGETSEQEAARILKIPITRRITAQLFSYSAMTVTHIENGGHLSFDSEGRIPLGKLCESMMVYLRSRKTSEKLVDDEKLRALKIQETELRIGKLKASLIPVDGVKTWLLEMLGIQHALLAAIPTRFTRDLKERERLQKLYEEVQSNVIARIKEVSGAEIVPIDDILAEDDEPKAAVKKRAPRKTKKTKTAA